MALGSHLITVRRLEKYINDVIGKKANLPDTSKTIIGNISQINSDLSNKCRKPLWNKRTVGDTTFTATDDCYVAIFVRGSGTTFVTVYINENDVYSVYFNPTGSQTTSSTPYFYISAGVTINYTAAGINGATVYESGFRITDCVS